MKSKILAFVISIVCGSILWGASAKTYLVSVGINHYAPTQKASTLHLCVNDAKGVVSAFAAADDLEYVLLTESDATPENIKKAMTIYSRAGENDNVVFFFSGHGYQGGFGVYGGQIPYTVVREAFSKSKSKNKMIFCDTCHSGKMAGKRGKGNMLKQAKKSNVMLFMASRGDEYSNESTSMSNGYFTNYLLEGLRGNADTNRDKTVTAREIYLYVHDKVVNGTRGKQHPNMWGKFPDEMPVIRCR